MGRSALLLFLAITSGCAIDREGTLVATPTCASGTPMLVPVARAWVDGTGRIPAHEAYSMRVATADCPCAGRLECEVEYAGDGLIALRTWTCDTGARRDCDSCGRLETTCE